MIARKYFCSSAFVLDMIASVPYTLLTLLLQGSASQSSFIMRMLRLFRLGRYAKLARVTKILPSAMGISDIQLSQHAELVQAALCFVWVLIVVHWIAMLWYVSVLDELHYLPCVSNCTQNRMERPAVANATGDQELAYPMNLIQGPLDTSDLLSIWGVSFYWAAGLLTGLQQFDAEPTSVHMLTLTTLMFFVSVLVSAVLNGAVTNAFVSSFITVRGHSSRRLRQVAIHLKHLRIRPELAHRIEVLAVAKSPKAHPRRSVPYHSRPSSPIHRTITKLAWRLTRRTSDGVRS